MRRKPGKHVDDHYASFNRRMWAATFDSLLVLILFSPFFEIAFNAVYPLPSTVTDSLGFQQRLGAQGDSTHVLAFLVKHFYETGLFTRWLVDTGLQTLLLGALTGYCWRRWAATPGKMLLKMKVVDAATEQPLTDQQIILRLFGYVVSSIPLLLGFFWISFDKRRQGWHDKIADTVVIRVPKEAKSDSEAAHP